MEMISVGGASLPWLARRSPSSPPPLPKPSIRASWATRTPAQVELNMAKLDELRAATGWTSSTTAYRGVIIKNGYLATAGAASAAVRLGVGGEAGMSTMLLYAINEGKTWASTPGSTSTAGR